MINEGPVTPTGPFRGNRNTVPTSTMRLNLDDGSSYDVQEVLKRVVEFWKKEVLK